MGISLSKGGRIDLAKEAPGLTQVAFGLGWDENESNTGSEFDLDASVFMLDSSGKIPQDQYFVFYNNLTSVDGSVEHTGDNRTGDGEGDDETIHVDLAKMNPSITELVFVVTIHEAGARGQNFGQVRNAFIRLYDRNTHHEIAKYDLEEDFSTETALEFGRLYKKDGSWRFKAVGTGYNAGLQGFVDKFVG
ncbi:MAG: TerD family protein [Campylobacterales bacterium]|nr:TerD family protein [Campylobacterales bacterium]